MPATAAAAESIPPVRRSITFPVVMIAGSLIMGACLAPVAGVAGIAIWWRSERAQNPPIKAGDGLLAEVKPPEQKQHPEPKQDKPKAVNDDDAFGFDRRTSFNPDLSITAPHFGTLRTHPWWQRPMSDADVGRIITAITMLPRRQELLVLSPNGEFVKHEDDGRDNGGEVLVLLFDNNRIDFYAARIGSSSPLSRPAAVSLLCQGLDAAHRSSEMARRTGKGFSMWEQFEGMGKMEGLPKNVPQMVPKPGPVLKGAQP